MIIKRNPEEGAALNDSQLHSVLSLLLPGLNIDAQQEERMSGRMASLLPPPSPCYNSGHVSSAGRQIYN